MIPSGYQPTDRKRSWGRLPRGLQYVAEPTFRDEVPRLAQAAGAAEMSVLAVGLGRSYGDSGLNLGQAAIDMRRVDRVMAFDRTTGVIRAEAGLSLSDLITRVAPHGWFPPTTPGTRFVTLGGAVANDVHGKNHHRAGSIGVSVRRLGLWRSGRGLIEISPTDEPELFAATIGGLGLTGLIQWVELQLVPIASTHLDQENIAFGGLDEFFALAEESAESHEHTVSWIDCASRGASLGRGIFSRANWRTDGRRDLHDDAKGITFPIDLPGFALNPLSLKLFNTFYYGRQKSKPRFQDLHYTQVFYPLDAIFGWNRLYGAGGFYQYQCVIPPETARDAVAELLDAISRSGQGSFLAVLKTFGDVASPGLLSFPRPGVTLALDFANRGDAAHTLMARLDDIVLAAGGRLYPAKDGRMPPVLFKTGYPEWSRFARQVDPACSSSFWRRIHHG